MAAETEQLGVAVTLWALKRQLARSECRTGQRLARFRHVAVVLSLSGQLLGFYHNYASIVPFQFLSGLSFVIPNFRRSAVGGTGGVVK